ncbi:MAG: D-isomer specific 2-hydroxyacid dehydrogenase NAD-binding protein, partial [Chloroflexi bacterium]|nr:D-isomer specific 2-hydroxyacid dehydrogenase NAD-binding protein [Chloroflexota bacterium]
DAVLTGIQHAAGPRAVIHVLPLAAGAVLRLPEVDVAFGHFPVTAIVEAAATLRWLHVPSAGVEHLLTPDMKATNIRVTNSSGVYGVSGAEHVIGQMLMFNRRLAEMYNTQREQRWDPETFRSVNKLQGQTIGVVGLGDIGSQIAIRARAFEMHILAIKRSPGARPTFVDQLWGLDRLHDLVAAADHIVIALPLTPETRGIIDGDALSLAKPTAYLYNIGRGVVLDEAALIRCLETGRLAGAGLDVFEEEPLPPHSPLWRLPNVLITPHVGANGPADWADAAEIFAENLERFRKGQQLVNQIDFQRGY